MRIDNENQELLQRISALEQERNHHTAELIRVGTLLSANTLTTGLAHEIKNPLACIQLTVSNLLRKLDKGTFDVSILRGKLQKIQNNADRINERISQARKLAEDTLDPTKPPTIDLIQIEPLFQQTLEGFQQQLSINEITVDLHVPADLPSLEANTVALEQVLANLLSNAIDALQEQGGGTIRLAAQYVAPAMVLTCHDTGSGIALDVQRRVFEPLFTTKGQGTGIGLWLCKTIIEHWQGTINFVSNVTEGTTFTITVPLKQKG
ncbi:HAMP domain-containing sensor histidine kinase [Anaerolineales bacterium HSG25]|nr:HAMP domain-containing sensor histidine kinase [Anaerolineales bacterium HSG25]